MQIEKIVTDDSMRELRLHGTPNFPFKYYYDDIQNFDKHYIEYHWHSEFEWCVVESGTVECRIDTKQVQLCKGDGIFINSKAIHSFKTSDCALMPNILFAPEFISPNTSAVYLEYVLPVLNSECTYFVFRASNETEHQILKTLHKIFALAQHKDISKIDIQISIGILWRDFMRITDGHWNGQNSKQDILLQARMRKMIQFIIENYNEKITLFDIASAANISKSEALRCFHQEMCTTPVQYLIDYRLSQAKKFLISTNDTVTQIASRVGIDNVSYFVRIFTKNLGITPKAFRLQCKKNLNI